MRPLLLLTLALAAGCISPDRGARPVIHQGYVTTYYDRNHDGLVDFELHTLPNAADADWVLSDTKFTGRYDLRLSFGFGLDREPVDLPVPHNVAITPGKPPALATQ